MNADDLKEILRLHAQWLNGIDGGVRANLRGANLSGANLSEADLREADLSRANLSEADLSRADLREANVSVNGGLRVDYHAPDPSLPRRVAEHALVPGGLNMSAWHKCETTHCLAGWAIHLSGDLGRALEALTSPSVAGSILLPSASHLFFAGEAEALAWCQEQVASGVDAQGGGGAK